MNGGTRWYVTPSAVTWFSCMHSSSADCVFGDARLISSTRRRFANTGPGRNSNSFERWLKTFTPVTSEGSRSGVNCRRENAQSSERESAFASIVFPTPGKSSMIRWPSLTRLRTANRSVSEGAWTTCATFSVTRVSASAEPTASTERSSARRSATVSAQQALDLIEDLRRNSPLRRSLHPALPRLRNQNDLVLVRVKPQVGPRHIVVDNEIGILAGPLGPSAGQPVVPGLSSEADEDPAVRRVRAEGAQDVV